jgi:hypothetical protein
MEKRRDFGLHHGLLVFGQNIVRQSSSAYKMQFGGIIPAAMNMII